MCFQITSLPTQAYLYEAFSNEDAPCNLARSIEYRRIGPGAHSETWRGLNLLRKRAVVAPVHTTIGFGIGGKRQSCGNELLNLRVEEQAVWHSIYQNASFSLKACASGNLASFGKLCGKHQIYTQLVVDKVTGWRSARSSCLVCQFNALYPNREMDTSAISMHFMLHASKPHFSGRQGA